MIGFGGILVYIKLKILLFKIYLLEIFELHMWLTLYYFIIYLSISGTIFTYVSGFPFLLCVHQILEDLILFEKKMVHHFLVKGLIFC